MKTLGLGLTVFSLLLLAAHALRWGSHGQTALWLLFVALIPLRQAWGRHILQLALLYGVWQWLGATIMLVQLRMAFATPWVRLGAIMSGVLLLTLAAAMLLQHPKLYAFFRKKQESAKPQALAFLLTFLLLAVARDKAPLPLLLTDRFFPGWGDLQIGLHALYAALLTGIFLQPAAHRRLRPLAWGLFSLIFFAQLGLGLAGVEHMLMTGKLHLPVPALILGGPLYRGHGFFMLVLYGSTLLLLGPAWCSHLCYIGAWDDGCSRISGKAARQPKRAPFLGRALTLALTVISALGLRYAGVGWPGAIFAAVAFGLGGVAVMVLISRKKRRMVHCTTYCPMGLVSNLFGRLIPWRIRMAKECTRCGACGRACRYGALRPADIEAGTPGLSCTLCGDCVTACPHGHLDYRLFTLSPEFSRAAFMVLACSLHSTFLAVARI